jgi:hypothetical protein
MADMSALTPWPDFVRSLCDSRYLRYYVPAALPVQHFRGVGDPA